MKEYILHPHHDASFADAPKRNYAAELQPEQLAVVEDGEGACLVLAGAGSGKTRTITYRVAYLIERGVAPGSILLLTFTNKAAHEMVDRIQGLLGGAARGIWSGTFHSIANRMLRSYAEYAGRTRNFTILDQDDAKSLMKACIKEKTTGFTKRFPSAGVVLGLVSYSRNASCSIEEAIKKRAPHFIELASILGDIAHLYANRKALADTVDFDDLLVLWRDLLVSSPVLCDHISSMFQYIFVDEYQDTNTLQAEIVSLLSRVHKNVLVVGDDAQSIYSFRAADIHNILRFHEHYKGAKQFRLTANYRSTPEILRLANESISHNVHQFPKDLVAIRPSCTKPLLVPLACARQEAEYIVQQLLDFHESGTLLSDMAVLFRAAFHSQSLEFELTKHNIPYEYRGGMRFFERAHIKDVIAFLRVVFNSKDETAWLRVLTLQGGIGPATASRMFQMIAKEPSLEAVLATSMQKGARAVAGWQSVCDTLHHMIEGNRLPSDMIRSLVQTFYRAYAEAEYPDAHDRLEDLEQFAVFAEAYTDVSVFLDEVSLTEGFGASRRADGDTGEDRLILSTIHQAKGLEWKVVCIMGLCEGKFPNQKATEEEVGIEEERRLFYVAVTRARDHLICTYPLTSGYDTVFLGQPSLFVEEVPREVFEEVRVRSVHQKPQRHSTHEKEERIIVLDELGERVSKQTPPSQFLRSVDEL